MHDADETFRAGGARSGHGARAVCSVRAGAAAAAGPAGRAAAAAAGRREPEIQRLRPRHHQGREVGRRRLHGPSDQGPPLLRDPQGPARHASSCGSARSPGRRSAPATADRRPATASCGGNGAATASCSARSPTTSSPMPPTPIAKAVEASNYSPIVMAFNIEALGKDDAAVIEVTRLFTTDVPEFSGRTRVGARAFDAQPLVCRARRVVPRERRGRSHPHLQQPAGASRRGRPRRAGARRTAAAPCRSGSARTAC